MIAILALIVLLALLGGGFAVHFLWFILVALVVIALLAALTGRTLW